MNTRLGLLLGVFVVQLLLVVMLLLGGTDTSTEANLLALNADDVDEIVVQGDESSITVSRGESGWQVESWPADSAKVDELVSAFADLAAPWPVATSASSAARFEVGDDNYQRRIAFREGSADSAVVFLGTSPGYQRVHARVDGSDDVYAVSFSNFKAPTKLDDWLDKGLLASDGTPTSIGSTSGFTLAQGEEGWVVDGEEADEDAARTYVERFANLRILGVAEALPAQAEEAGQLTVVDGSGELIFTLSHEKEEDDYFIRSSRSEGTFKLATYIAEQLLNDKESLLPDPSEAEDSLDTDS